MSPEAIQSLIEMFGVEKGVQILNLFTVQPEEEEEKVIPSHRPALIRSSRRRDYTSTPVRETVSV
jgi:hypothetical protein